MTAPTRRSCVQLLTLWLSVCGLTSPINAQLRVLSQGNTQVKWRETQVSLLRQQLAAPKLSPELELELRSQVKWLEAWKPGGLTKDPIWESASIKLWPEPTLDPQDLATGLRERLLGKHARPTAADTTELQDLLTEHADDLGLRQLHLHWLDQIQYRDLYPREIADAASKVLELLNSADNLRDIERVHARAFSLYRRGRALVYRAMPEVVAKLPFDDGEEAETSRELVGTYLQLQALVKEVRPEFIFLETHMLRRDHWYGRALDILEKHGSQLSSQWFLKNRSDTLRELGWDAPAKEAQAIYEAEFPAATETSSP